MDDSALLDLSSPIIATLTIYSSLATMADIDGAAPVPPTGVNEPLDLVKLSLSE